MVKQTDRVDPQNKKKSKVNGFLLQSGIFPFLSFFFLTLSFGLVWCLALGRRGEWGMDRQSDKLGYVAIGWGVQNFFGPGGRG